MGMAGVFIAGICVGIAMVITAGCKLVSWWLRG